MSGGGCGVGISFIVILADQSTHRPRFFRWDFEALPLSEVLGNKARLLQRGMSEAMAQANLDMWVAYGKGLDTAEPRTPQSTTPTNFRQWCEDVLKPRVMA